MKAANAKHSSDTHAHGKSITLITNKASGKYFHLSGQVQEKLVLILEKQEK